jgi:hypothetical protein
MRQVVKFALLLKYLAFPFETIAPLLLFFRFFDRHVDGPAAATCGQTSLSSACRTLHSPGSQPPHSDAEAISSHEVIGSQAEVKNVYLACNLHDKMNVL